MHETRAVHSTIAAAPMADDDGSLEELTCPITNEVFLDPVLCVGDGMTCLLYTSPSPRDATLSRMPSSA